MAWASWIDPRAWRTSVLAGLLAMTATFLLAAGPSLAQDDQRSLNLIDIHQGGEFSDLIQSLSMGGYELDQGKFQDFGPWYQTYWRDFWVEWLLQTDADHGIIFGLSTGEHGEKYSIDPALKIGGIVQWHFGPDRTLSLTAGTTLFGHLQEFPCTADYRSFGISKVNCRLAAGILSPEKTLKYLLDEKPSWLTIKLTYSVNF